MFKKINGYNWRLYETSTVESVQTKIGITTDDLENYHNLTYTLDCLFAIATAGELHAEGENKYLKIDKALFKTLYKKSVTFPFEMLEKYSFYFSYFKSGKETDRYKRCNYFHVYYENNALLMEAIKFLENRLSEQEKQKEMPEKVAFMLADYDFILTGKINSDILRDSIMNTLGSVSVLWEKLINALQDVCKLTFELSFQPYVFPNKTITLKHNKKTVCKLFIDVNRVHIRLPLSYETAKELIINRKSLPRSIDENINCFNCVGCCKCENQNNIEMFEGVNLCKLSYSNFVTEDSRCLRFDITTDEEVKVISEVIKQSL